MTFPRQALDHAAPLVAAMLRSAAREAGTPAGRTAMPRSKHYHALQLHR